MWETVNLRFSKLLKKIRTETQNETSLDKKQKTLATYLHKIPNSPFFLLFLIQFQPLSAPFLFFFFFFFLFFFFFFFFFLFFFFFFLLLLFYY